MYHLLLQQRSPNPTHQLDIYETQVSLHSPDNQHVTISLLFCIRPKVVTAANLFYLGPSVGTSWVPGNVFRKQVEMDQHAT